MRNLSELDCISYFFKNCLLECFKKMCFYSVILGFPFYTHLRKIHTWMSQKFSKDKILKHVLYGLHSHWFRYVKISAHFLAWFFFFSNNYINAVNILIAENMVNTVRHRAKFVIEFWGASRLAKNFTEFLYQVRRA